MTGILPEGVRTRQGKADLSPRFIHCMQRLSPSVIHDHILSNQLLSPYLDQGKVTAFCSEHSRVNGDYKAIDAMFLFILLALGTWMQKVEQRKNR